MYIIMNNMSLTQKDLQSIRDIVKETENKLEKRIRSEFAIQNIMLDTKFRSIDSRFDNLEKRMEAGFERVGKRLYEHDIEIETLKERVDDIDERMPLHS